VPGGHAGLSPYDKLSSAFRDGALVVSRRMGGPNKRATKEVAKSKNGDKVDVSASDAAPADLSGLRGTEPFFCDADHKARQTLPIPRSPIPDPGLVVRTKFYACNPERNEAETIESQTRIQS